MSLLLALLALQDPPMDSLLEKLRSDDPLVREQGVAGLLKGWKGWSEQDLARLEGASGDPDPEVGARATETRELIRIRRSLGENLLAKVPGADAAFHSSNDKAMVNALIRAKECFVRGELAREDLEGLEFLAGAARWNDPAALGRFIKEFGGGVVLTLPADPAARARVRAKAVLAIGGEGSKRILQVAGYLGDEAPEVRATALRVIDGLEAKEQAPKVATLLRDPNAGIRRDAVTLLARWNAKEYAADFVKLLEDPSGQVRRRAAETLGGWGQKEVAPDLAKLLKDPYAQTRAEAAVALGSLGAREFAADVAKLLADPQPSVRRGAAYATGRFGATEHAAALEALLADRDPDVRMTAAQALGQLGAGLHVEALVPLLTDSDAEVRLEAAWVLGRVASKGAVLQIEQLENRDPEVRQGVVRVLGRMGLKEYRGPVAKLCSDPTAWVRAEAVSSLGLLGAKDDAATLGDRLRDADRKVRVNAALALGELGAGDPQGALAALERDPDRLLGLASTLALIRLGLRDAASQRAALREIAADGLAFAVLGRPAMDALSRAHSKDAWDRLSQPLPLRRTIDTWKDLAEALAGVGLKLELEVDGGLGRLDERVPVTGHQALEWLLGRIGAPVVVLDGTMIRLMDRRAALLWWQKKLDGR